jgi:hypothetical protein
MIGHRNQSRLPFGASEEVQDNDSNTTHPEANTCLSEG